MTWFFAALALLWLVALGSFALVSRRENEPRATRVAAQLAVAGAVGFGALALWDFPGRDFVGWSTVGAGALALIAIAVPDRGLKSRSSERPAQRVDERTTMFSRRELQPGSEPHTRYYTEHPEHREADDHWRRKPGLMGSGSRFEHRRGFTAAHASFEAVEKLHALVDGEPSGDIVDEDPARMTGFVRAWARKLGAVDAGVTLLDETHVYRVGGRRERRDGPIVLDHRYAIAFTVEMDHAMMQAAPDASTLMESAQQYLESGSIAVQLAAMIRGLGHPARAHIDANYQVICPLVARDAGLGELGRMGLLMTPQLGPRVRIGVVTTDLPLEPTGRRADPTAEDFCLHCRKCAAVCPSQAIPFGDVEEVEGARRWKIDDEACFNYWCEAGTDCGRCMVACPYSHPDSPLHNLVRRGIRHSPLFRRGALWMDDLFYGRKPQPRPLPEWMER